MITDRLSSGYARRLAETAGVSMPPLPDVRTADFEAIAFEECVTLHPVQVAERSRTVRASLDYLHRTIESIHDAEVRQMVADIYDNPNPSFMDRIGPENKKEIYAELRARGLVDTGADVFLPPIENAAIAPQPFHTSAGSHYHGHNAYPGGLVTHTSINVMTSLALYEGYKLLYRAPLDLDVIAAAQLLHDHQKPWVLLWDEDGAARKENRMAGSAEHHPLGLAESIFRGFPPEIVIAQACTHRHPLTDREETDAVRYLIAGSILAGIDPVDYGLLQKSSTGYTLPHPQLMECFLTHMGDQNWAVTLHAMRCALPALRRVAQEHYRISEADLRGKIFNALRNYVFAQLTVMGLYDIFVYEGEEAMARMVLKLVRP